jgi:hypothetical protein
MASDLVDCAALTASATRNTLSAAWNSRRLGALFVLST